MNRSDRPTPLTPADRIRLSASPRTARLALEESRYADVLRELRQMGRTRDPKSRTRQDDAPTGYDREARRVQAQMRADGLLPDRRHGVGPGAWHAAKCAGLALAGFAYLVALVAGVALVGDYMGVAL